MGSFNVACSISNISINSGTKIAFIPLLPSEMSENIGRRYNNFKLSPGYVYLPPSSNWVSNEGAFQFYKPFSLPIIGRYNDYGGIEDIDENITSKVIKDYFGISIEDFVDCVGNSRTEYDYFSPIFNAYFEVDKKLLSDYSTKFNENWMKKMGFTKNQEGLFQFEEQPYLVSLFAVKADEKKHRQAGFGYEIISLSDKKSLKKNSDTYDNRERFLSDYLSISDYYIGYKKDCQDKIKLMKKMSGMFVHYDIYEFMSKNTFSEYSMNLDAGSWVSDADLNEHSLKKLGFVFRCEDKSIDRYTKVYEYPGVTDYVINCDGTWSNIRKASEKKTNGSGKQIGYGVYHPNQLILEWEKLTGIKIKVEDSVAKESKFGSSFDQIREQYIEFLKEEESEEEKEINAIRLKRAEELKSNPEALKEAIEKVKSDPTRLEITKTIILLESNSNEIDDIEEAAEEAEKTVTDEMIGRHIIKSLEERFSSLRRYKNPLSEPKGHVYLPLKPRYDEYNMLITLYESFVKDGSIRQDVIDFCDFYWNMYAVNKVFMPASNGYQCGCHPATYHLAKKTMEITQSLIRDFEEEIEEEEV